jgi:uncharacterized protein (DUF2147 family)
MKTGIARRWAAACLLAALALPLTGIGNAEASQVDGTWVIRDLALHIFDCRHPVCGRIVGIKDAVRRQSQCGKTIVWGLEEQGPNEWDGGSTSIPMTAKPTGCRQHFSRTARFMRGYSMASRSSEGQRF